MEVESKLELTPVLENKYILWPVDVLSQVTGLGRTAIYDAIKKDNFPKPLRVGSRRSMWRKSDVLAWIDSRPQHLELKTN